MIIVGRTEPYWGDTPGAVFYNRDFMCVNSKCKNYAGEKTTEKVPDNEAARQEMMGSGSNP
jgi:hypothetical protein